jgi:RNA polymerase sigma-70 factor (ECF subfamily)
VEPDGWAIYSEQFRRVSGAMAELPVEQREVVTLHLYGGLPFREIAERQKASIKTIQSRYRYALDKLRSQLNGKVEE